MTTRLSEYFTLEEMILSQTAARRGYDNRPAEPIVRRLAALCREVLDPAREHLGPLRISSGYRSPALNAAVGGSRSSAHCLGYAADVIPLQSTKRELAWWLSKNVAFDQLILEFGTPEEPAWIHVSIDPRLRGQILRADQDGIRGFGPIPKL